MDRLLYESDKLYQHFKSHHDVFISEIPDVNAKLIIDSIQDIESADKLDSRIWLARLLMKMEYAEFCRIANESSEPTPVKRFSIRDFEVIIDEFDNELLEIWLSEVDAYGVGIAKLQEWVSRRVIDNAASFVENNPEIRSPEKLKKLMEPAIFGNIRLSATARRQLISIAENQAISIEISIGNEEK